MEIIAVVEHRRRWRIEEKMRIVTEAERPGACIAEGMVPTTSLHVAQI